MVRDIELTNLLDCTFDDDLKFCPINWHAKCFQYLELKALVNRVEFSLKLPKPMIETVS